MSQDKALIANFLKEVKKNKKYKSLSDEIVIGEIKEYLKSNPDIFSLNKQSVKEVRAGLHRIYSGYQTRKKGKMNLYIDNLKKLLEINNPTTENIKEIEDINNKLLSLTLSTKERLPYYREIYRKIFSIAGIPKTIVDLGAGLNPLSILLMNLQKLNYYSYDINEEDAGFLNKYFAIMKKLSSGLNGKAAVFDIRDLEALEKIPDSDIVLMFKVIDLLDVKNKKTSEEIIKNLIKKTGFIVASFATRTITRKPMNFPKRKWFELMLARNNLSFKKFEIPNEIFYVIKTEA